jgi:hypothetical protein
MRTSPATASESMPRHSDTPPRAPRKKAEFFASGKRARLPATALPEILGPKRIDRSCRGRATPLEQCMNPASTASTLLESSGTQHEYSIETA